MLCSSIMAGDPAGSISASPAELPGHRVILRGQTPVWLHHTGTLSDLPKPVGFQLFLIKRTDPLMLHNMRNHYSKPLGMVGRNICYAIMFNGSYYGTIAGGSATRFLPGRHVIGSLNNGVNNIFFHVDIGGGYPIRNFTSALISAYRNQIQKDWKSKYGDDVLWHETLVEIPRTGECYKRDGWTLVGQTKGYTCKRTSGKGTDSWSGKRVWDTENLRPKLVFVKTVESETALVHK